jgi:tetratricopeptide (TPR) repeat protein
MGGDDLRKLSIFDAETVAVPHAGVNWVPVRRRLGIRAFGTNAYRAARAGDRVIEDHVESPGPGARFEIGGETLEAEAGEIVFVPDPTTRRGAIALEDQTVVFGVGGWPGEAYRELPWEPIFLAQPHMAAGDWAEAAAVLEGEAGGLIDHPFVQFRLGCCLAQAGDHERALECVRRAIDIRPELAAGMEAEELLAPLHDSDGWPPGADTA